MYGKSRIHSKKTYTLSDNNYIARQYGFDVQHEWDFRGGKDYFIAGVLGKRETYRTTSGPYYGIHIAIVMPFMVHTPIKSILHGLPVVGLRYTDIKDPVKNQHVLHHSFN